MKSIFISLCLSTLLLGPSECQHAVPQVQMPKLPGHVNLPPLYTGARVNPPGVGGQPETTTRSATIATTRSSTHHRVPQNSINFPPPPPPPRSSANSNANSNQNQANAAPGTATARKEIRCDEGHCLHKCENSDCHFTDVICGPNALSCELVCMDSACKEELRFYSYTQTTKIMCDGKDSCEKAKMHCGDYEELKDGKKSKTIGMYESCSLACTELSCKGVEFYCGGDFSSGSGCEVHASGAGVDIYKDGVMECAMASSDSRCKLYCSEEVTACENVRYDCSGGSCSCGGVLDVFGTAFKAKCPQINAIGDGVIVIGNEAPAVESVAPRKRKNKKIETTSTKRATTTRPIITTTSTPITTKAFVPRLPKIGLPKNDRRVSGIEVGPSNRDNCGRDYCLFDCETQSCNGRSLRCLNSVHRCVLRCGVNGCNDAFEFSSAAEYTEIYCEDPASCNTGNFHCGDSNEYPGMIRSGIGMDKYTSCVQDCTGNGACDNIEFSCKGEFRFGCLLNGQHLSSGNSNTKGAVVNCDVGLDGKCILNCGNGCDYSNQFICESGDCHCDSSGFCPIVIRPNRIVAGLSELVAAAETSTTTTSSVSTSSHGTTSPPLSTVPASTLPKST